MLAKKFSEQSPDKADGEGSATGKSRMSGIGSKLDDRIAEEIESDEVKKKRIISRGGAVTALRGNITVELWKCFVKMIVSGSAAVLAPGGVVNTTRSCEVKQGFIRDSTISSFKLHRFYKL